MKVRELIAGSILTEGAGRSGPSPRVSVILPTFRRGDSGLLSAAIDSILDQSLRELELLIVDDASTDSTAGIIAEAMLRDPRVSVIRHARNIGLPAVSEYEGYLLARGDRIAFAFDDTYFAPTALERLLAESDAHPSSLIVGWVNVHVRASGGYPARIEHLGQHAIEEDLLATNVVANSAVLAPKAVLDEVGLYDPHVSLARLCDYDLWLRARRKVAIRFIDLCVGDERGPATLDSLGSTYPLDQWTADDRMRQHRDELLRPDVFGEIDVFDQAGFSSDRSRALVARLAHDHRSERAWISEPSRPQARASGVPRVMVLAHPIDASTLLVFEAMRDDPRLHVRIIDPTLRSVVEVLEADALIVSRQLRDMADWIGAARAIGIPVHFYLDDNLPLMRNLRELNGAWDDYEPDTLRAALQDLDGVLASTEALAQSFREQALHRAVASLPISVPRAVTALRDAVEPARATQPRQRVVALFIGAHRLEGFRRVMMPALRDAATRDGQPLTVLVPAPLASALGAAEFVPGLTIEPFEPSRDCFVALRRLRDAGTTILAVPDSPTVNGPFKSLHPVLSAAVLGAELLTPQVEPYTQLGDVRGVHLVESAESHSWAESLSAALQALTDPESSGVRAHEFENLRAEAGASALLDAIGPVSMSVDLQSRIARLVAWQARELALTRVQVDLQLRTPQPLLDPENPFGAHYLEMLGTLRDSRRFNALKRDRGVLQRFPIPAGRGERMEIGEPLTSSPYRRYDVHLAAGDYESAVLPIWSYGLPGDLIGIEVVDCTGRIALHSVATLPRADDLVEVVLDARDLHVEVAGVHEVRIFVRTNQPAFLIESVYRGALGMRRPVVRPLIDWQRRRGQ